MCSSDLESRFNYGAAACNLAAYALAAGDLDGARTALSESLAALRDAGAASWLVTVLEHHAVFAALRGANERAAELFGYTSAMYRKLGQVREGTERYGFERLSALLTERYGDELPGRLASGAQLSEREALALAEEVRS